MRNLMDILDLSVEEIGELIDTAEDIIADGKKYSEVCRGKKLATLFFELITQSTRYRYNNDSSSARL